MNINAFVCTVSSFRWSIIHKHEPHAFFTLSPFTLCMNLVGRPNHEVYVRKTPLNVSWGYDCSPDLGNCIALVKACFQTTVDF